MRIYSLFMIVDFSCKTEHIRPSIKPRRLDGTAVVSSIYEKHSCIQMRDVPYNSLNDTTKLQTAIKQLKRW